MIGKSLNQRHTLTALTPDRAGAILTDLLASHAAPIVQIRARDAQMIACMIVTADPPTIRLCRALGFEVKRGGTAVFGLLGPDLVRLLSEQSEVQLGPHRTEWLETSCGPRETKVLLLAGGFALLSLETSDGNVTVAVMP